MSLKEVLVVLSNQDVIPYEDLKRLRLVGRDYNKIVCSVPRYINSQVKFGRRWKGELKRLNLTKVTKWENVCFYCFCMTKRNRFVRLYWESARLKVKILTLHKVQCDCRDLADFIRDCNSVANVTINNIHFREVKGHAGINGQQTVIRTVCDHKDYPRANEGVINVTIKNITIKNQKIIPICVLDLLKIKCRGVLEDLNISGQNRTEEREVYSPTQEEVHTEIRNIINENIATLKILALSDYDSRPNNDGLIASTLLTEPNIIQELQLIFKENFSNYRHLFNILENLNDRLKVFHLEFQKDIVVDLSLENRLSTISLDTLVVKKAKGTSAYEENFTPEFLNNLPNSLKKLSVDLNPAPTAETFSSISEPGKFEGITQLIIGNGAKNFTNGHMHAVIRNMPLLQELQVISASQLSDNGICSISPKLAENILKTKAYYLLATPELLFRNQSQENLVVLSQLKHLRKISFKGCSISDISIRLAFNFPEVRHVDLSCNLNVTDIGLFWLCKQNPQLEKLTVKDNIKVSQFGINELISNFPFLVKIYTTHVVSGRTFSELDGYECPRFNRHVHVSQR